MSRMPGKMLAVKLESQVKRQAHEDQQYTLGPNLKASTPEALAAPNCFRLLVLSEQAAGDALQKYTQTYWVLLL